MSLSDKLLSCTILVGSLFVFANDANAADFSQNQGKSYEQFMAERLEEVPFTAGGSCGACSDKLNAIKEMISELEQCMSTGGAAASASGAIYHSKASEQSGEMTEKEKWSMTQSQIIMERQGCKRSNKNNPIGAARCGLIRADEYKALTAKINGVKTGASNSNAVTTTRNNGSSSSGSVYNTALKEWEDFRKAIQQSTPELSKEDKELRARRSVIYAERHKCFESYGVEDNDKRKQCLTLRRAEFDSIAARLRVVNDQMAAVRRTIKRPSMTWDEVMELGRKKRQ